MIFKEKMQKIYKII